MATSDSTVELSPSAVSKMKVAELKKELKGRGLSTAGTKTELIERLQNSGSLAAQDLASEDGNAESEILDEDEVLGGVEEEEGGEFDDDDLTAEAVLADEPKVKSPAAASLAPKRPAPEPAEAAQEVQPKKRVLVRPNSVTSTAGKENGSQEKNTCMEVDEKSNPNEKKVVKLSAISVKERLDMRAQKFGVPLSEAAKKEARAARFGISTCEPTKTSSISASTKITVLGASDEVLKKRAERFGGNVSTLAVQAETDEKLKKRQERFGVTAASVDSLDDKKKLRAERFKL